MIQQIFLEVKKENNGKIIKQLVNHFMNHNSPSTITKSQIKEKNRLYEIVEPHSLQSPVHRAAECGNIKNLSILLDLGFDVNHPDSNLWTPLHSAANSGQLEAFEYLVSQGSCLHSTNNSANTPIHFLVRNSFPNEKQLTRIFSLLDSVEEIDKRNIQQETPLHYAVTSGDVRFVEYLLGRNCSLRGFNTSGDTPLHIAIRFKRVKIVKRLLRAGADPEIGRPPEGQTSKQLAEEIYNKEILKLIEANEETSFPLRNKQKNSSLSPSSSSSSSSTSSSPSMSSSSLSPLNVNPSLSMNMSHTATSSSCLSSSFNTSSQSPTSSLTSLPVLHSEATHVTSKINNSIADGRLVLPTIPFTMFGVSSSEQTQQQQSQFLDLENVFLSRGFQNLPPKIQTAVIPIIPSTLLYLSISPLPNSLLISSTPALPSYLSSSLNPVLPPAPPPPTSSQGHWIFELMRNGPTLEIMSDHENEKIVHKGTMSGQSTSTYPHISLSDNQLQRLGDPICDFFKCQQFSGNLSILCLCDGCGWGKRPFMAAKTAVNSFVNSLRARLLSRPIFELPKASTPVSFNWQVIETLLSSLAETHKSIVDLNPNNIWESGATTLAGGVLFPLTYPLICDSRSEDSTKYLFTGVSIGDVKVYHISFVSSQSSPSPKSHKLYNSHSPISSPPNSPKLVPETECTEFLNKNAPASTSSEDQLTVDKKKILVRDISTGNRRSDPTDCGGRLGPIEKFGFPDLRNLSVLSTELNPGDFILLVSDGVHDNLSPELLGVSAESLGLEKWTSEGEMTAKELEKKQQYQEQLISQLLLEICEENQITNTPTHSKGQKSKSKEKTQKEHEYELLTSEAIVKKLIEHSKKVTNASREFTRLKPGSKLPTDYLNYPGKMDHTTALCIQIPSEKKSYLSQERTYSYGQLPPVPSTKISPNKHSNSLQNFPPNWINNSSSNQQHTSKAKALRVRNNDSPKVHSSQSPAVVSSPSSSPSPSPSPSPSTGGIQTSLSPRSYIPPPSRAYPRNYRNSEPNLESGNTAPTDRRESDI